MSKAKSDEELLLLNSASIFLHFSYNDGNGGVKSWYDFTNSLQVITRKMIKEYVDDENKERIVLKKSLWPTICSGDKKMIYNFQILMRKQIDIRQEVLVNQRLRIFSMVLHMLKRGGRFLILNINL